MKVGRNELCSCGSGKKYKHCCLKSKAQGPQAEVKIPLDKLSLRDRNLILLTEVFDIFKLNKGVDWPEIKKTISGDQIRKMFQVVAQLWPHKTDLKSILSKPSSNLRSLYLGDTAPDLIVNSVFRFSLYTDEIFIISPFLNPWCIVKEFNPIEAPDKYKAQSLRLVFFAVQILPWVEAGLVHLIPDPGDFDYQLRKQTWEMAQERLKDDMPTEEDMAEELKRGEEEMKNLLLSSPNEFFMTKLKEQEPNISEEKLKDYAKYLNALREQNPFCLEQALDEIGPQMTIKQLGTNLEMALYICHMTGAFPYTNVKFRWKELQSVREELPQDAQVWTPLTQAFQNLDFKFMNNIDTTYACNIRKEGRLEGFRAYLRRIWTTLNEEEDLTKLASKSRDFTDELTQKYNEAEADWQRIDKDLLRWLGSSIAKGVAAGGLSALIDGKLGLAIGAGYGIKAVTELVTSRMERRAFRKKVPMSILIDLKHQKG